MYRTIHFMSVALCAIICTLTVAQAQAPKKVLILGDSIMQAVSRSLERQLAQHADVETAVYTHIGTGLARLDLFDWHAQIERQVTEHKADTVFIMMGANDNQPMQTPSGIARLGTPEWEREYAQRAGRAMDLMINNGVLQIHWIELPDMREARLQSEVTLINRLVRAEAGRRPQVTFQETRSFLSRSPGEYSPYIIQPNGMPLDIRSGDGIHLNRRGGDYLAEKMIARIFEE